MSSPEQLYNRGLSAAEKGHFQKALEIQPDYQEARLNLEDCG